MPKMKLTAAAIAAAVSLSASSLPGDAKAGQAQYESQKCASCHSVSGKGGTTAPDLAKRTSRGYTPADMAAALWNHAPQMFEAMDRAGIARPALTRAQSADLFAFFYAARYFDRPGDAGRGRQLFVKKGCAECHNVSQPAAGGGNPVINWPSVADPLELARQMWNHAPQMREAMAKKKQAPPVLSSAEMNDIIVWLQNLPQHKSLEPGFAPASPDTGETLFRVKGCVDCHQGANALDRKQSLRTTADFAAAMWNHSGKMVQLQPSLRPEEMTRLVGYLWSQQFANPGGDAGRGERVWTAKGCSGCHAQGLGAKAPGDAYGVVSALWTHGAQIQAAMKAKQVRWPALDGGQINDLLAYVNKK